MRLMDWILFSGTLVMGLLTGMYLYFTIFIPEYVANQDLIAIVEERKNELNVTANQYGGCSHSGSCVSFSLSGDRQYRYDSGAVRNLSQNIDTGDVPRALFNQVEKEIKRADLKSLASPVSKQCTSWVDGTDVTYTITLESRNYVLDSCTSYFALDSELGLWLNELFVYMYDPENYEIPDSIRINSVADYIEHKLDDNFSE